MWPGQQPPGGEQHPQDPNANPYQQPGYQQPNPYQQPGYQQPNPYQQPGYQQGQPVPPNQGWESGGPGGFPPPNGGGKKKKPVAIAIAAATVLVVGAAVTGYFVLFDDKEPSHDAKGGGSPSAEPLPSKSQTPEPEPEDDDGDVDNPRAGGGEVKPVVKGWKTVVSRKRQNAFDVPPEWKVESQGLSIGFEDSNSDEEFPPPLVTMSAPAFAQPEWCTYKENDREHETELAAAGSKGAQGAKSTDEAAENEALSWVFAAYDQGKTGTFHSTKAKPFTSEHGLTGSVASATVTGVKKENKCSTDGKAFAVSYVAESGDYGTWVLYAAKGVKDEIPDATIKKIMNSLRPLKPSS
ncbi:hypothetical protein [Streptomyces sp. TP-A0874]|uniref:hypothetical protein n=1 Tax=Streptomyces sp. TP-A0874 TaxID=549819 RepID=UPI000852A6BD|nr:hypothetical protein [Streptomyces sp. TP-A0874]